MSQHKVRGKAPGERSRRTSEPPVERNREIIEFALVWRHWGGGSDSDIFVEFGIPPREYFRRLESLIERGALANQPTGIVGQIIDICRTRRGPKRTSPTDPNRRFRTNSPIREGAGA
ncbi:DUF3263 domain-containing protein [Nocardia rhamnosiphila]